MANSNRNPKDLKHFVEKCKSNLVVSDDTDDFVEQTVKSLRHISHEDKTEMGMYKFRIEEQSRLIMILKQRCDDFIRKNMALEKINQLMESKHEEHVSARQELDDKYAILKDRFEQLNSNHEEIIKIKDDYKQKLLQATETNQKLKTEQSSNNKEEELQKALETNVQAIDILKQAVRESEEKIATMSRDNEVHHRKLTMEKMETEHDSRVKLDHYKNECDLLRGEADALKRKVNDLNWQLNENTQKTKLLHEKEIKLTQERDALAANCDKLREENNLALKNYGLLEIKLNELNRELKEQNVNNQKKLFEKELEKEVAKYTSLQQEYLAYKTYSNSLIEKERDINAKLRYIIS